MDQKMKEKLPQLSLDSLSSYDRGKLDRQFTKCLSRVLANISDYPVRGQKAEPRKITLEITLTPIVKFSKTSVETSMGNREAEVPEIVGLLTGIQIKDKVPVFQSDDVVMAVEMKGERIADLRFNPNNNNRPDQLEFDLE